MAKPTWYCPVCKRHYGLKTPRCTKCGTLKPEGEWKKGVKVAEEDPGAREKAARPKPPQPEEEYPTRPLPLVLFGCAVSLFLPGAGHAILGYEKLGIKILLAAAVTFGLGLLFGVVLSLPTQVAALPLFFVWLFALQDLYAKGTGQTGPLDGDGVTGDPAALVNESSAEEKVAALRLLTQSPDPSHLQAMENALLDDDAHVSEAAGEALAALGPSAVDVLIPHLGSTRWGLRKRAIVALKKIGNTKALEALAQHRKVEENYELTEMLFDIEDLE
jgi:hypothetical protein